MANNTLLHQHLRKNEKLNHYFLIKNHDEYIEIIPSDDYKNTFRILHVSVSKGDLYSKEIYIKCQSIRMRWNGHVFGFTKYYTLEQLDTFLENTLSKLPSFESSDDMISLGIATPSVFDTSEGFIAISEDI